MDLLGNSEIVSQLEIREVEKIQVVGKK